MLYQLSTMLLSNMTLVFGLLVGSVALYTVVLTSRYYRESPAREQHRKRRLARDLERTQLLSMLQRMGIAPSRHLALTPSARLRQQLRRCHRCTIKADCEAALRGGYQPLPPKQCPNRIALKALQAIAS